MIRIEHVSKSYPRWGATPRTVRGLLSSRVPGLARMADQRSILRDVSLEVGRGEAVGVIGRNGAGKSTLLRLVAGLGAPSGGRVLVSGELRAVLSLGETFDPLVSGRDNALTGLIIAGVGSRAARSTLTDLLTFAELEEFADAPLRTYSEGMKLRLAMAVAMHLPADVFVLDEVLAVGDLRFQERCLTHLRTRRDAGLSLLFASHDLDRVQDLCERCVWLDGGRVRLAGPTATVIGGYRSAMMSETLERTPRTPGSGQDVLELGRTRFGSQEVTLADVALAGEEGQARLSPGGTLQVTMRITSGDDRSREVIVAVAVVRRRDGVKCVDLNSAGDGVRVSAGPGGASLDLVLDDLALEPGDYEVEVGAYQPDWSYAFDLHTGVYPLSVSGGEAGGGVLRARRRWSVTGTAP